jgi:hypothetical protein
MTRKPESVSFLIKNLCYVELEIGIIIAMEIQEGKEEMAKRDFVIVGGKASTARTFRMMSRVAGRSDKQGKTGGGAVGAPAERISHACVGGKSLGLGGVKGEGSAVSARTIMQLVYSLHAPKTLILIRRSHYGCVAWEFNATVNICTKGSDPADEHAQSRRTFSRNPEFRIEVFVTSLQSETFT